MSDVFEAVKSEELLKWVIDLVRIPSYSGLRAQEAAVGRYIKSVFDSEGISCRIAPLKDGRCNVYARLEGTGGGSSLMFNGHMDTVPAYGMERAYEPWLDDEGRLHGRGTSDMKGPLAAMMAAVIALKRGKVKLAGDVLFTGVADEEEGSLGAISMIESDIRADAAVVGEPTGLNSIAISQKGLEWYQFDFAGRTVHGGAYREGVNAILMAVRFIDTLERELMPKIRERSLPLVGESTMNIGVIHGGTQLSTVPGECYVQLDRRFLPTVETYESCSKELLDIVHKLEAEDPKFKCEMKVLESSVMEKGYVHQGFVESKDDPFIKCVQSSIEEATGEGVELVGCPCWTDAGLISHYAHTPVVVYGPGDMTLSHSSEEFITVDSLNKSLKAYILMAMNYCG